MGKMIACKSQSICFGTCRWSGRRRWYGLVEETSGGKCSFKKCSFFCFVVVVVVWGAAGVKVDSEKGHILGSKQSMHGFILTCSRLYSENR